MLNPLRYVPGFKKISEPPVKIVCRSECDCKHKDDTTSASYTVIECDENWVESIKEVYGDCSCDYNYFLATVRMAQGDASHKVFAGVVINYECIYCGTNFKVEDV